jgi:LytS/YehU family sensor histidine kinase
MTRARGWFTVWAGWTALALFFAAGNSLTYKSTGRPANWALSIERSLAEWWPWAAATPAIAWLAWRFPVRAPRRTRYLIFHAIVAAITGNVVMLTSRALFAFATGVKTYILVSTVALNAAIYACIVAAAHGVEFYRRSRERDQLEAGLADARLQLLAMQLQPHFLFNTLNTIAELVHEDAERADAMIASLSDLLRRSLDVGARQCIPLRDEVDLVMRYIDIQRARYGDRLQVTTSIDADAAGVLVPPLLLQPIVENAVRHGVGSRLDAGRIEIEGHRNGGTLVLVVTDDGDGAGAGPERIGLGNTRARLDGLYGPTARLTLTPTRPRGTRVTIELPAAAEVMRA